MSQPRMPGSPDSLPNFFPTPDVLPSTPVPPYVFFLIMFGIGLLTLLVLYVCVRCIRYRRRNMQTRGDHEQLTVEARAREAADMQARALSERMSWQVSTLDGNHGTNGGVTTTVGPIGTENSQEPNLQNCEFTYVVMAGEDRPRYLAHPALAVSQEPPSPQAVELSVKEPKE